MGAFKEQQHIYKGYRLIKFINVRDGRGYIWDIYDNMGNFIQTECSLNDCKKYINDMVVGRYYGVYIYKRFNGFGRIVYSCDLIRHSFGSLKAIKDYIKDWKLNHK